MLYNNSDEIGKNAHDRPCYQYKDQYTGNTFFQVGILAKEMPGIEQEAYQEDDPKDNWKDGSNGIGNIVYGIFDSPDLCKCAA
tara:strand:- start:10379 stop:10627 length:249 start_codon:yes stop_codon:yes gene_type:complete